MTEAEFRERKCKAKVAYLSQRLAENAYTALQWAGRADPDMESYQCRICRDWHLGHPNIDYLNRTA